jgi:aarF domain-containing kinase
MSMSAAQAERLAEGLCRMRGAALKIGQMLSLTDESMLPPQIAAVLERVRTQADIMPRRQLEKMMAAELGPDWRTRLGGDAFEDTPVAAASIGQVHRSVLPDGRKVAIKVQYPGVAESIQSDINNLKRLLTIANFLPPGLHIDSLLAVAKEELTAECDYRQEAEKQERFRALAASDADFVVPSVVRELSTRRVLVSTWLDGMPIDQIVEQGYPQAVRNHVARKLLKLTIRELFEWRFMQTDPNWGNFFYDPATDRIGLLDFGAAREFPKAFVDDYLQLVWAAANKDSATIEKLSVKLGFLTGFESRVMTEAHVASGLVVGEPFATEEPFDFRASGMTKRVAQYGSVFAEHRLSPPPNEVYSLHRKLAGAFFICIRMGAVMRCRDILADTYANYKWGPEEGAAASPAAPGTSVDAAPQKLR